MMLFLFFAQLPTFYLFCVMCLINSCKSVSVNLMTPFLIFCRYLYIDLSKSALAAFSKTDGLTDRFSSEHNIDLDVSNVGNDPIGYCLTGDVNYTKSANPNPNSTSSLDASLQDKILQFDVVDNVLTGGDSCRYCVNQCPQNQ